MIVLLPDPMTFPVRRSCVFNPPEEYARLRAERPFSRLRLAGGRIGWLVTRHEDVRATLTDPRFSPPLIQVTPATELPLPEDELDVPARDVLGARSAGAQPVPPAGQPPLHPQADARGRSEDPAPGR